MAKTKIEDIYEGVKNRLVMQQFAYESSRTAKGKFRVMESLPKQVAENAKMMNASLEKVDLKNVNDILELEALFNTTIDGTTADAESLTRALSMLNSISERYSELYDGHEYTK